MLGVAATALSAWLASPAPSDLAARVTRSVSMHGGREVPLSDVAPVIREAVIATEDERFYRHHGIDVIGVARAMAYDVSHLTTAEGASTITEQLAKNLHLGGNDHNVWRKLEAATIAVRIEAANSKPRILDDYLNTVYFGENAYGIDAASERYFRESPSALTLDQASLVAGLIQSPSGDDPYTNPAAARARQAIVLGAMARNGFITGAEGQRVLARPLRLAGGSVLPGDPRSDFSSAPQVSIPLLAGALTLLVLAGTLIAFGRNRIGRLGLRIAAWGSLAASIVLVARALRAD